MNTLLKGLKRFVKEEDAPTMVEYGLMVALIAVACITAVGLLGTNISSRFNQVATEVGAAS